jgi:predicted membrane protein (TIGR00267 family)
MPPCNVSQADQRHHEASDPHRSRSRLSEMVLGGQDGLVNVLGVLLGVAAASHETRLILAAGFAAACAESVSMAAVAYTSSRASGDLFESERAREYRHIRAVPHIEREEIRAIYARKGFTGELLERIVATITSDPDVWVAVMMSEEHALVEVDTRASVRSAVVVGVASLVGSLIPLVPFALFPVALGIWASVVLASATLFAFGVYKARRTVGHPLKSGATLVLIGLGSALIGFGAGALFQLPG